MQGGAARESAAASLDRELAGLVPGQPTACLPEPTRVQVATRTYGTTVIYVVSRNLKYRNDTTGGCDRAGTAGDSLITRTTLTRSCRGDIVQTVDRNTGVETGSCALGDFIPYRRP